ncbi:hypothetical protein ACH41H_18820 [Streptomyces sp. NPDC020800]|uniref:hypothetical protein n=1 Tax=Streptomyces sp. NPDC020800 TaxID=3365092 RepID=UPI003799B8C5
MIVPFPGPISAFARAVDVFAGPVVTLAGPVVVFAVRSAARRRPDRAAPRP